MKSDNPPSDALCHAQATPSPGGEVVQAKRTTLLSRRLLLRVLMVLIVIAITVTIFIYRERVAGLEAYGYLGAFLISLITGATIILPVPGIAIIFALGHVYDPILVGLAAGAGSALGEITGYMAGFSGQVAVENSRTYMRLVEWMKRKGTLVILIFSFVPNPFFDLAGMAAGMLRYPLWRFLIVCFLGKTPRNMLVAFAGAWALDDVIEFFQRFH
jgi:uncharacterized membrane protein YdjX (TVP38/TMEM64 family)